MDIAQFCISRYPGPTLKALELLQQEKFRKHILSPAIVARLIEEGVKASLGGNASTDNAVPETQ